MALGPVWWLIVPLFPLYYCFRRPSKKRKHSKSDEITWLNFCFLFWYNFWRITNSISGVWTLLIFFHLKARVPCFNAKKNEKENIQLNLFVYKWSLLHNCIRQNRTNDLRPLVNIQDLNLCEREVRSSNITSH